eukprot:359041-Chlamydomonas_euryale.AAC.3
MARKEQSEPQRKPRRGVSARPGFLVAPHTCVGPPDREAGRQDASRASFLTRPALRMLRRPGPQYTELETLYKKYKNQGLVIAGFPCNQFGAQEPGSNAEIKRFAQSTYGATFPLFSKV